MSLESYQHINLEFLENFTRGDHGKMSKYIGMFLKAAPTGIESMRKYFEAGDWENLRTAAHSLKPQIGYMGIGQIKEHIVRIEEYAREENHLDEIPQLIDTVAGTCEKAFAELRDVVERISE